MSVPASGHASSLSEGKGMAKFDPQGVAEKGEEIYAAKFQERYEAEKAGHFVAIDVLTAEAYVAPHPEEALELARRKAPDGIFHLIKIGSEGAFRWRYAGGWEARGYLQPQRRRVSGGVGGRRRYGFSCG